MTQAVDTLMHTEASLRTGSPEQKQQILAKIIHDYQMPGPRRSDHRRGAGHPGAGS